MVLLGLLHIVTARSYVPAELEVWKRFAEQTRQQEWTHCNTPSHVTEPCSCNKHEHAELHAGVFVHCVSVGSVMHVQRISLRENNLNGIANVSFEAFTRLELVDLRDNTQLIGAGPEDCLDPAMLCMPQVSQEKCLLECTKEGCQTDVCEVPTASPTTPTLTAVPTQNPSTLVPTSEGTDVQANVTEAPVNRPGATFGQTLNAVVMILLLVLPFCGGVLYLLADRDDVVENADGTQRTRSKWYFTSLGTTIDLNEDSPKNREELYGQSVVVA